MIVTLLTDFGSSSPYPAEVKGVLLTLCRATIVDITHDVPRHDIVHGAFLLAAAAPAFPTGTVHLAVVDPGVGTARQALAVASGGQFFVGPDNGLLLLAARALGTPRAHSITVERFARRPLAPTFHGRDLFAPVAAALAGGLPVGAVGPPAARLVELLEDLPTRGSGIVQGQVRYRDPFGNLVTNIPGAWLEGIAEPWTLEYPDGRTVARRGRTYADGAPGQVLVLVGSSGTVEIAINAGHAGAVLGIGPGARVALRGRPGSPHPRGAVA